MIGNEQLSYFNIQRLLEGRHCCAFSEIETVSFTTSFGNQLLFELLTYIYLSQLNYTTNPLLLVIIVKIDFPWLICCNKLTFHLYNANNSLFHFLNAFMPFRFVVVPSISGPPPFSAFFMSVRRLFVVSFLCEKT